MINYFLFPSPFYVLIGGQDERWCKEGDQLEVEGELTMAQFLGFFHDVHQLQVTLVAAGNLTLHSFLLPEAERAKRSAMT